MSKECTSKLTRLSIGEKTLEALRCERASATGTIVLLHEALGSVSYWKNFPGKLAEASNCNVDKSKIDSHRCFPGLRNPKLGTSFFPGYDFRSITKRAGPLAWSGPVP